MTTPNNGYPCPSCGSTAFLGTGCPGCGAGPDPLAAEVIRLDGEIAALGGRVEQARQAYLGLAASLRDLQTRRADLAARVRAAVPARRPAPPPPAPAHLVPIPAVRPMPGMPAAPLPVRPPTVRPETSTRTVQNLLFILGGLLLGTAAIVFTAVAWASVGVIGRAAILAGLTGLVLALPLLAVRRRLTGTAETFAAVGLLLVVLDGYAAWTVDLAGVSGWPDTRYAALVGGASAAVAAGYARLSRLRVPWFVALIAGQPVLPLAVASARPGAAGWALAFVAVALGNLAVAVRLARRPTAPVAQVTPPAGVSTPPAAQSTPPGHPPAVPVVEQPAVLAGRVAAWVVYGAALAVAAICALTALATADVLGTPLLAGAPLLLVVLALAAAGYATRLGGLGGLAGALLVLAAGAAVLRPLAELRPSVLLVGAGVTVALLTLAVLGAGPWLPGPVRLGTRIGALTGAGLLSQVAVVGTVALAGAAVARSVPPWRGAAAGPELSFGWQLPVTLTLVTAALVVLLPRVARVPVGTVGAAFVVLAAPAVGATPWPVPVAVELVAGIGLLLVAVARPAIAAVTPVCRAGAGALLAGHALLVSFAAPGAMAAVLGLLLLTGVTAAALTDPTDAVRRRIGGTVLTAGLLAGPAGVVVGLLAAGAAPWWQARGALGATALLLAALVVVRRWRPACSGYAVGALAGATLVTGLTPLLAGLAEPVAIYASTGVLLLAVALVLVPAAWASVVAGVVLVLATFGAVLPGVWTVLVAPYDWVAAIWSGVPDGVGLAPGRPGRPGLPTGVALVLLALAAAVPGVRWTAAGGGRALPTGVGYAGRRTAVALTAVALPVLLAGAGLRWPVVPAVLLVTGLALLLTAALAPARGWLVPVGAVLATPGLAGLLAARPGTLGGLGLTVVAAVTAALAGRSATARVAGWVGAVLAGATLALTAPLAAGLSVRVAAFAVLGVAVLALAVAALLHSRRPAEGWTLDAVSHGTALAAFLLTLGSARHAAAVCTLWGVAVGVRALRPGETTGRRWRLAVVAGASEVAALWLLLSAERVALLEAYTVPAAVVAVGAGWLALRTRPGLSSWLAYGPGLAAALLPSLASVLVAGDQAGRRLLLGAGALVVVLVGATQRRQAPVVLGGGTLTVLALHEMVRSWDLLPRWIYLAVGGLVLIGLATTYERRRRDLNRLRAAVGRMS